MEQNFPWAAAQQTTCFYHEMNDTMTPRTRQAFQKIFWQSFQKIFWWSSLDTDTEKHRHRRNLLEWKHRDQTMARLWTVTGDLLVLVSRGRCPVPSAQGPARHRPGLCAAPARLTRNPGQAPTHSPSSFINIIFWLWEQRAVPSSCHVHILTPRSWYRWFGERSVDLSSAIDNGSLIA